MSNYRYGRAKGLSTAEKLSDAQVIALTILRDYADRFSPSAYRHSGGKNNVEGLQPSRNAALVLVDLGLAERNPEFVYSVAVRITKVGRAILNGRLSLDAKTDAIEVRR